MQICIAWTRDLHYAELIRRKVQRASPTMSRCYWRWEGSWDSAICSLHDLHSTIGPWRWRDADRRSRAKSQNLPLLAHACREQDAIQAPRKLRDRETRNPAWQLRASKLRVDLHEASHGRTDRASA